MSSSSPSDISKNPQRSPTCISYVPVLTLVLVPGPRNLVHPLRTFLCHFHLIPPGLCSVAFPPGQTILLLLNSTLATALTLTYPGLKCDGGPRPSAPRARRPTRPLASQRVASYPIMGTTW